MCLSVFREDVCQPKHSVTCWSSRKPVESALLVIPLACCLFMFLAHNTMSSPAVNTQNIWHACAVSTSVLCIRQLCGAPTLQSAGAGAEPAAPRSGGCTGEAGHMGPNICMGHVFAYDGETLSSQHCIISCSISQFWVLLHLKYRLK